MLSVHRRLSLPVAIAAYVALAVVSAAALVALGMTVEVPVLSEVACEVTGGDWKTMIEWAGPSCFAG